MRKVKVGQLWRDREEGSGGTFLVKEILSTSNNPREGSTYVTVFFLTGIYTGITRNWYVDMEDILVADTV